MRSDEKREFLKKITVLVDTREQKNEHIISVLKQLGIMFENRKLDYGDYSFIVEGKDFSHSCVVERKAKIDELYGNVTTDRERIEKMLEGCKGWEHLKAFEISSAGAEKQGRKVRNIGETVYSTLQAWRCGNRYSFDVEFVERDKDSAAKMLERFYWFWHNYKKQTAPRK